MTRLRVALLLSAVGLACADPAPRPMSAAHEAAIRDSVADFLTRFAAFQSSYPGGDSARAQGRRFYSADVVYSGDVLPSDPVLIEGYDALTADATRPGWLRAFEYRGERTVVLPLAPGVAAVTELYRERFIDTTGATTPISGAALMVLRNTPDGWRIVQLQTAHPASTDSAYAALVSRFERPRP